MNLEHLTVNVVGQELGPHVVLVWVVVGARRAQSELQQRLQPRPDDVVDLLRQLALAAVHQLYDKVTLVQQEVVLHRPSTRPNTQSKLRYETETWTF